MGEKLRTWMMDRRADTEAATVDEQDVLDKLRELLAHGYGRLEVVVREGEIATINWQKSLVRADKKGSDTVGEPLPAPFQCPIVTSFVYETTLSRQLM